MKLEFSLQIFEKYSKSNFVKIRPVEDELFPCRWIDRRINISNLIIAFHKILRKRQESQCVNQIKTVDCAHVEKI